VLQFLLAIINQLPELVLVMLKQELTLF